jgi:hypothetical protein
MSAYKISGINDCSEEKAEKRYIKTNKGKLKMI